MEEVKLGRMLPGAIKLNNESKNQLYIGSVNTDNGITKMYVKLIPERELFVETACSLVGRLMNIPIPKPYLVLIDKIALAEIPDGIVRYGFGTEDVRYRSLKRHININDEELLWRLEKSKKIDNVVAFDECIGNPDRHLDNILYNGSCDFIFIDHGEALSPTLEPETMIEQNQIFSMLYADKTELERQELIRLVQSRIAPQYAELPFSLIFEKTHAELYLGAEEIVSIVDLFTQRAKNLYDLMKNRIYPK